MINFDPPITINPPTITQRNGVVRSFSPIVVSELEFTLVDNAKKKFVHAQIFPVAKPLVLWKNEEYDSIGDYTQEQAEAKILELLGANPEDVIENLFF